MKVLKWIRFSSSELGRTQNIKHVIQALCSYRVWALLLSSHSLQLKIMVMSSNVPSPLSTNSLLEDFRRNAQTLQCPNTASVSAPIHSSFTSPGVHFAQPLLVTAGISCTRRSLQAVACNQLQVCMTSEVRSSPHLNTAAPTKRKSEG